MAWPTITINTSNMDAASDDASQARADIKQMADNVNDIKNSKGIALGVAELDPSGLLPVTQLPVATPAKGGTGQSTYTVGDILIASAAGVLSKLVASTLGYVLTSNGPGVAPSWQLAGGGLTSGVRMLFQNTTAPIGWTKEVNAAFNNVALRIVTGTVSSGGADAFSTVFGASKTTAAHTLTTAQMPAHNHPGVPQNFKGGFSSPSNAFAIDATSTISAVAQAPAWTNVGTGSIRVAAEGGGGSHSHGLTLDLKYRDFIIAQKD